MQYHSSVIKIFVPVFYVYYFQTICHFQDINFGFFYKINLFVSLLYPENIRLKNALIEISNNSKKLSRNSSM